jgi:hypothetical protein
LYIYPYLTHEDYSIDVISLLDAVIVILVHDALDRRDPVQLNARPFLDLIQVLPKADQRNLGEALHEVELPLQDLRGLLLEDFVRGDLAQLGQVVVLALRVGPLVLFQGPLDDLLVLNLVLIVHLVHALLHHVDHHVEGFDLILQQPPRTNPLKLLLLSHLPPKQRQNMQRTLKIILNRVLLFLSLHDFLDLFIEKQNAPHLLDPLRLQFPLQILVLAALYFHRKMPFEPV